jgi:tRNA modification GTPase
VLGKIFKQVIGRGAAIAEPGEFTKRAFLNGRIDLTQAEAVIDIIQAKSETALQIANHQLAGGLSQKIDPIKETLQSIRVLIEAAIDFPEDIEESIKTKSIQAELERDVIAKIDQILGDYKADHYFRDGVKMAVIGRPNVGKSSLMNRLIDRERAIVTAIPGTTRDVIEEVIHIKGLPVVIMDTAGLHSASGEVEKIGMQKTQESIQDADIVLFMIDASMAVSSEDEDIFAQIEKKKHVIVYNKIDLIPADHELIIASMWQDHIVVPISALNATNLDQLKNKLWSLVVGKTGHDREIGVVPNMRHKQQLEACLAAAKRARRALKKELPAELIAADIMDAIKTLGAILGDQYPSDLLDQIFSRFCIGK